MLFPEAARLLNATAFYLDEHAQYPQAEPPYKRALAIRKQMLGPSYPNTKTIKDNYVILSQQLGVFDNAHSIQRQADFLPALTCASLALQHCD